MLGTSLRGLAMELTANRWVKGVDKESTKQVRAIRTGRYATFAKVPVH